MTDKKALTEGRYAKLLTDIRCLLAEGKERARAAATQEIVRTYWTIGERLSEESLAEGAGYGEAVMEKLAEELRTDVRTLQRTMAFYRAYKERAYYEAQAEKEGWTRDELARAIELGQQQAAQPEVSGKGRAKRLERPAKATYVYGAEVKRVIEAIR